MTAFTDAVVKICREEFATFHNEQRKDTDAAFDTCIDFVKAGRFEAHCDFVVGFDAQKKNAITIGGNVGNSVSEKT